MFYTKNIVVYYPKLKTPLAEHTALYNICNKTMKGSWPGQITAQNTSFLFVSNHKRSEKGKNSGSFACRSNNLSDYRQRDLQLHIFSNVFCSWSWPHKEVWLHWRNADQQAYLNVINTTEISAFTLRNKILKHKSIQANATIKEVKELRWKLAGGWRVLASLCYKVCCDFVFWVTPSYCCLFYLLLLV